MSRTDTFRLSVLGTTALVFSLAAGGRLNGQDAAAEPLPAFEVASVKKAGSGSMGMRSPGGGRLILTNIPLRIIIQQAWGIRDNQIVGGPKWMASDRFSINAKAETNAPRAELMLMLRSLLMERFKLKARIEQREMPVYVLSRIDPDAPLTGKVRPSKCPDMTTMAAAVLGVAAPAAAGGAAVVAGGRAGPAPASGSAPASGPPARGAGSAPAPGPPAPGGTAGTRGAAAPGALPGASSAPTPASPSAPAGAAAQMTPAERSAALAKLAANRPESSIPGVRCGSMSSGPAGVRAGGMPISLLTSAIGSAVGATVVDRTGLTGMLDIELEFSLFSSLQASAPAAPGAAVPTALPVGRDGPSIFTAVKDVGLKLERRREATEVLVIDSVEQPDED